LDSDTPATIDENGKLHVAALVAVPDPPSLVDLRRRVEKMMPKIDLPELVLEVMSWHPDFVEAFTHVSGNDARAADLGLSVAAVLCSYAMNVGFKAVTSPGAEALTRDRLHHVDQNYVRFETLAAANSVLVKAQAEIGLGRWAGRLRRRDAVRGAGPHHSRSPEPEVLRQKTWNHLVEHAQRPVRRSVGPSAAGHAARLAAHR
jgi:hypothetical protein